MLTNHRIIVRIFRSLHKRVKGGRPFFCYTIAMKPGLLLRMTALMAWVAGARVGVAAPWISAQGTGPSFSSADAPDLRNLGGAGPHDSFHGFMGGR